MNDLTMTVTGWVATEPRLVVTRDGNGTPMCTFRLAQTARYFDRNANQWTNGNTEWFSVRVFRDSAALIAESIHKGQPVIVEGRLRTNEWTDAQDVTHWGLQLDATCVGHDLTKGIARFTRATVAAGEEEGTADAADAEGSAAPDGDGAFDEGAIDGRVGDGIAAGEAPDDGEVVEDPEPAEDDELADRPAALV